MLFLFGILVTLKWCTDMGMLIHLTNYRLKKLLIPTLAGSVICGILWFLPFLAFSFAAIANQSKFGSIFARAGLFPLLFLGIAIVTSLLSGIIVGVLFEKTTPPFKQIRLAYILSGAILPIVYVIALPFLINP